jgi:hypothetical protein
VWLFLLYLALYPLFDRFFPTLTIAGYTGDVLAVYASAPICCILGLLLIALALPQSYLNKPVIPLLWLTLLAIEKPSTDAPYSDPCCDKFR